MRVFGTGVSTDPKRPGLFFRGGDICDPQDGNWFAAPFPTRIFRSFVKWPILPYLCLRLGRYGFYFGWKCYGVDSDAYKNWLPAADVYAGSLALCFTARFFSDGA